MKFFLGHPVCDNDENKEEIGSKIESADDFDDLIDNLGRSRCNIN